MKMLSTQHRSQLERKIVEARDVAETGARMALESLAVQHHEPYAHMASHQRTLRRRLRAHARHLGDRSDARSGRHTIDHLVHECAYEHWHGMLFARFLAENDLLIEPEMGVPISLGECEELAKEEGTDKWTLAARYAHHMLPQIFRPDHPVLEVQLPREFRLKLERLVESLPAEVFAASDALGWVYQFWQSKKKDEINVSEVKIGADELPAVTQLFTEPYMVQFLLQNSLGAWWVSHHPDQDCPVDLCYLRRTEDGTPAAGGFEKWPDDLSEFRLLDPCCGSGHFLVSALLMLVPMRVALEDLSIVDAIDAVLEDNIHGLEIDQRCVAIAAFALAIEAWRYPNAGGFRMLPKLNLAWCGQPVVGKKEQWLTLAEGDARVEAGMARLYDTFRDAPMRGSLIDPDLAVSEDLWTAGFAELKPLLEKALRKGKGPDDTEETVIAALGLAETARLLSGRYHAVLTNVPYLGREKHTPHLRTFCQNYFPLSKHDLATVFLERILGLCGSCGEALLVLPQYWLFLARYKGLRRNLLQEHTWHLLATLGPGAFESISGEVVNTCLVAINRSTTEGRDHRFSWIDATKTKSRGSKEVLLRSVETICLSQARQLVNPDSVIGYIASEGHSLLENIAHCYQGLATSDNPQFVLNFWEVSHVKNGWEPFQFAPGSTSQVSGCSHILLWENGEGKYARHATALKEEGRLGGWKSGHAAWGKRGIAINRMGQLPVSLYFGTKFDCNVAVLIPHDEQDIPAIWKYCTSQEYSENVRRLNAKLSVTNATLAKVPFDRPQWEGLVHGEVTSDLFSVETRDPTQWTFHGHPRHSTSPLHVSVVRLLGYRWPAEIGLNIGLSDWSEECLQDVRALDPLEDNDGIVCIPSVRGERSARDRLIQLLHAAYRDEWHDGILTKLLVESGCVSLDDWLCNRFFEEHCKLFQHRPFVWHVWDGRKRDGFHALVNYHRLAAGDGKGRRLLESLTYSYLGDWITRQQDDVKRGEGGAEDRLNASLELQKRLIAIVEGEPPFDLFVRWKPIEEQPIGWEPDIHDGVRLNIRPFMAQDLPGGKKGAGILRAKPNIHWKKDRGKEPMREQARFPWFWKKDSITCERINDVHIENQRKRSADAEREISGN